MGNAAVKITLSTRWTAQYCCSCGIPFAVPKVIDDNWQSEGKTRTFYCPNGHSQHYIGQSDAQRADEAEKKLRQERQRREWAEHNANEARASEQAAKRSLAAQKGVTTKIKNRVSKGVCPCCNRTFQDLQRHMSSKHPDYATETR